MLTQARLKEVLHYNPVTGVWTRKSSRSRKDLVNKSAGSLSGCGYLYIRVDDTRHSAHRLAFLYMTGKWPPKNVDHKNLSRDDCKWKNLRPATKRQNQGNVGVRSDNVAGLKGVTYLKQCGMFQARITHKGGRREHLGLFKSGTAAHRVYARKAKELFGSFARTSLVGPHPIYAKSGSWCAMTSRLR